MFLACFLILSLIAGAFAKDGPISPASLTAKGRQEFQDHQLDFNSEQLMLQGFPMRIPKRFNDNLRYNKKRIVSARPPLTPIPRNLRVEKYDLQFKVHFPFDGFVLEEGKNMTFEGQSRVHLQMIETAEKLTFDQTGLDIQSVRLFDATSEIPIQPYEIQLPSQRVTIRQLDDSNFVKGRTYLVEFVFTGKLLPNGEARSLYEDGSSGPFFSSYPNANGTRSFLLATHFETNYAQRLFPCIDDPHFKAAFNLTLIVPSKATALGNSIVREVKQLDSNFKQVSFNPTLRMSTYLFAFVVGHLSSFKATTAQSGVQVEVWSWKEMAPYLEFAANESAQCLQSLEDFTGIAFPMEKLDIMGVPYLGGAMENYGLIISEISLVAANLQHSGIGSLVSISDVLCHEIAHQYFGDWVTTDTWGDVFLNEAFATFFSKFTLSRAHPERTKYLDNLFVIEDQETGLNAETYNPISLSNKKPLGDFGSVTYDAGGSILRMVASALGLETFQKSLHYYLQKNSLDTADTQNLIDAYSKFMRQNHLQGDCAPIEGADFLEEWLRSASAPIVSVDYDLETGDFSLSQKALSEDFEQNTWNVPILTHNGSDTTLKWLLKEDHGKCQTSNSTESVLLNLEAQTFSRFRFSDSAFEKILKVLEVNSSALSDSTKLRLVLDLNNLRYDAQLLETAFPRLQKLLPFVFASIGKDGLNFSAQFTSYAVYNRIITEVFKHNSSYLFSELISPLSKVIPWDATEDWNTRRLQENFLPTIVYHKLTDQVLKDKAKDLGKDFLDKCVKGKELDQIDVDCNHIPPSTRQAVYCAVVASNDSDLNAQLQIYHNFVETNAWKYYLGDEYARLKSAQYCVV